MAKRRPRPEPRWFARIAEAKTPAEELSAAYDGLTAALARMSRKRRDTALEAASRAEADRIRREVAHYLADRSAKIRAQERGDAA